MLLDPRIDHTLASELNEARRKAESQEAVHKERLVTLKQCVTVLEVENCC